MDHLEGLVKKSRDMNSWVKCASLIGKGSRKSIDESSLMFGNSIDSRLTRVWVDSFAGLGEGAWSSATRAASRFFLGAACCNFSSFKNSVASYPSL